MSVNKQILHNNITLLSEPVAEVKTVAIGFWFSVGSRYEKQGEYGITHFTEHLLFKGTNSKTTHDIACVFDRIGGYVNAFTERENVCLYCIIPSEKNNVTVALKTLCEMAYFASFPTEELERERTVVQNEITAAFDDAESCALDEVALTIWKNQSISRIITGSTKDVKNLTREQIIEWYKKYFVLGELTVCVSGNINETDFISVLQEYPCRNIKEKISGKSHFEQKPIWHSGTFFVPSRFTQMQVFELFPYKTNILEHEFYTLCVFNALCGDTMSSRLFESLREKNGCCYNVYSFFCFYEDTALWASFASCDKEKLVQVCSLLQQEIRLLEASEITENEIEAAKEHLCGEEIVNSEDMEYRMKRLQRNFCMNFPLRETSEILSLIRSVSKKDIIALIKDLLVESEKTLIIYGSKIKANVQKEILC